MAYAKDSTTKIRYAFICDGDRPPQWAAPILDDLLSREAIENHAVINIRRSSVSSMTRLVLINEMATESLSATELEQRIQTLDLDFALNLSEQTVSNELLGCFPQGVWAYRFGRAPTFKEIGANEISMGLDWQDARLERQGRAGGACAVLKSGALKLFSHSLVYHRWASVRQTANWAGEVANYLARHGSLPVESILPYVPARRLNLLRTWLVGVVVACNKIQYVYDKVRRQFIFQQWNIGIVKASIEEYTAGALPSKIKWWPAPASPICLADPFPVLIDGRLHVLAEKFSYVEQFGSIVSTAVDDNGQPTATVDAIQFPHHLSYPCLAQADGHIYAAFEALETKELRIYRCEKFPNRWVKYVVVATGSAFADPTLFKREGRWWMMATTFDSVSSGNTSLNAWYSEAGIAGPWRPHELNPIKTDIRSARSGGSAFESNGQLYRPSQNCMRRYGRSLNIMHVRVLTPSRFQEERVSEIKPDDAYPDATHHISGVGPWTVIDGRRDRFSLKIGWLKLSRRFRALGPDPIASLPIGADVRSLEKEVSLNTMAGTLSAIPWP